MNIDVLVFRMTIAKYDAGSFSLKLCILSDVMWTSFIDNIVYMHKDHFILFAQGNVKSIVMLF